MTREEAIMILENLRPKDADSRFSTCEIGDALNMAIKALEQEPCEDAISRTEAIRVASGYCHWSNIPDELAKLPSVSTEKTGRWILTDKKEEIYCHVAICSVCGMESINEGVDDYCSCCGARMEVEE